MRLFFGLLTMTLLDAMPRPGGMLVVTRVSSLSIAVWCATTLGTEPKFFGTVEQSVVRGTKDLGLT